MGGRVGKVAEAAAGVASVLWWASGCLGPENWRRFLPFPSNSLSPSRYAHQSQGLWGESFRAEPWAALSSPRTAWVVGHRKQRRRLNQQGLGDQQPINPEFHCAEGDSSEDLLDDGSWWTVQDGNQYVQFLFFVYILCSDFGFALCVLPRLTGKKFFLCWRTVIIHQRNN